AATSRDVPGTGEGNDAGDSPASSCAQLDTSPFPYRGSPPSPTSAHQAETDRPPRRGSQGISTEERDQALSVLSACLSQWRAQGRPARVPPADELAEVTVMTAVALRYIPPSEVT